MAATIAGYLALVGPFTEAITALIQVGTEITDFVGSFSVSNMHGNNFVNVGVGMYEGGATKSTLGGDGLWANVFTQKGTYIGTGKTASSASKAGEQFGTTIQVGKGAINDVQAHQLTLAASGADDVCVQFIELIYDGKKNYGFDGTWGRDCGQDWYYSQSQWGYIQGVAYTPTCFWITTTSKEHKTTTHPMQEMFANMELLLNGANVGGPNRTSTYCNDGAIKFSSLQVAKNTPEVADGLNDDQEGLGPDKHVQAPDDISPDSNVAPNIDSISSSSSSPSQTLLARQHPHVRRSPVPMINRRESSTSTSLQAADVPRYPTGTFPDSRTNPTLAGPTASATGTLRSPSGTGLSRLVTSEVESHSASDLCNHPNSRGPDFVSLNEQLFCDMSERKIYPLCNAQVVTDCFAVDHAGKRMRKRTNDKNGESDALHKQYSGVEQWKRR